jgi:hypothetical protein
MISKPKTIFWLFIFVSINIQNIQAQVIQSQVSNGQVVAIVEALRLAAFDGNLYSDWQVKPSNITRWSKRCLGKAVTPDEFAANSTLARQILECKMGRLFQEQYEISEQNEDIAVLRTASWWMTGIAENYNASPKLEVFTQNVLKFYQQHLLANNP